MAIVGYLIILPVVAHALPVLQGALENGALFWKIGKLIIKENSAPVLIGREGPIFYGGGQTAGRSEPGISVPLAQIPPPVIEALIYQEDQDFYSHHGYSLREIGAALRAFFFHNKPLRGASTITQQLARTLYLDRSRSLKRKLLELRIARILERELSKEKILELYLNYVYWGKNRYGLKEAAAHYFRLPVKRLGIEEAALLIALLPNPDSCRSIRNCRDRAIQFRRRRIRRHLLRIRARR